MRGHGNDIPPDESLLLHQEHSRCGFFFALLQPCKIAKSPWLQPLKVTYSVLSAFLLFHLVTKGTLAENSRDFGDQLLKGLLLIALGG